MTTEPPKPVNIRVLPMSSDVGTPVPLRQPGDLMPFPVEALPAWLGEWVREAARSIQVPIDMPGALALGMCSAALAGKVTVKAWGDWGETANLYIAVVAESGERKTAAFNAATAPLAEFEDRAQSESMQPRKLAESRHAAREERRKELRRAYGKAKEDAARAKLLAEIEAVAQEDLDDPMPPFPKLWTSNVTPEMLTQLLAELRRIAVCTDEGSGVFENLSRYSANGAANMSPWLEGYDGSRIRMERRKGPTQNAAGLITSVLALQPEAMRALAQVKGSAGYGFVQRWLWLVPQSLCGDRVPEVEGINQQVLFCYRNGLRHLLELPLEDKPVVTLLSPEASELLKPYSTELEHCLRPGRRYASGPLKAWGSKHPGRCLRLACVLHWAAGAFDAVSQKLPISGETMAAAIQLSRYFESHAMGSFGVMEETGAEADARALLEWLEAKGLKRFAARDLRNLRFMAIPERRAAVLELLVELGHLVLEPDGRVERYRRLGVGVPLPTPNSGG